jgi:hypothetical protein
LIGAAESDVNANRKKTLVSHRADNQDVREKLIGILFKGGSKTRRIVLRIPKQSPNNTISIH